MEEKSVIYLLRLFAEAMEKKGFKTTILQDRWQPQVIAAKEGHYKIKAIGFLDPFEAGFVAEGTVGLDTRSIFYYQINPPFSALDTRFENMMREMEPFIAKKLEQETVRMEF